MIPPAISSRGRTLALLAALLGWMFDGMEMALFPLVGKDALGELLHVRDRVDAQIAILGAAAAPAVEKVLQSEVNLWYGVTMACFLVGAATGGVVFGWLGDKIGRVKAMTVSVLMYSLCSGLSAVSQTPEQFAVLRFLGALGMGGEWALGVALVMEVWPNASRGWLAGWIGAFGNFGYLLCGLIGMGLNSVKGDIPGWLAATGMPGDWAAALTANGHWRLLMLIGAVPALLTLFIRLFVPESEKWLREKESGAASRWSGRDLLGVLVGAVAALGVIAVWVINLPLAMRVPLSLAGLVIVIVGYLMPVRGYLRRSELSAEVKRRTLGRMLLAAGLSGVALLGTWAGLMWVYLWVMTPAVGGTQDARAWIQVVTSIGAIIGCVAAAVLGESLGRRPVYAALCVLSGAAMVAFYRQPDPSYGAGFVVFAGVLGLISAAFYGWLPLYLPELFPTACRATGQGFGYNFGRIIAAVGQLQMPALLAAFGNDYGKACAVVAGVYAVGLVLIAFAPETKGKPLPD